MCKHATSRFGSPRGALPWIVLLTFYLPFAAGLPGAEDLPWAKNERSGTGDAGISGEIFTARSLLAGIEDSQLELLRDGSPSGLDEQEVLAKILYRLSRPSRATLERFTTPGGWEAFEREQASRRWTIVELRGRLTQLQRIALLPELAERLEFTHYWQATLAIAEANQVVDLYLRTIPANWRNGEAVDERVRVNAMFLKRGAAIDGHARPVFAAESPHWYPDTTNPDLGVTPDLVRLGELSYDVSLFEQVRGTNGLPLGKSDQEAFYQLLAAVGRISRQEFESHAAPFELAGAVERPREQHGRWIEVTGTAREVKWIAVEDPSMRERFGFDHYFEVDLLVAMGDQSVRIGKEGPVINNSFPVTCCMRTIPADWQQKLPANGSGKLRDPVRFVGVHFKVWGYNSERMERAASERPTKNERNLQISPLLIGQQVTLLPPHPPLESSGTFFGTMAMVLVALVAVAVWWLSRTDRQQRRRSRAVLQPAPRLPPSP
jgi:hypothetical protein